MTRSTEDGADAGSEASREPTLIEQGEHLFGEGLFDEAALCFEAALRVNPFDKVAHNNLGVLAYRRLDFSRSRTHLLMALGIDPMDRDAWTNLYEVLERTGELHLALPLLERIEDRIEPGTMLAELRALAVKAWLAVRPG